MIFSDIFGEFFYAEITPEQLNAGTEIIEVLSDVTKIFPSRGEARKALAANAVAINKAKITDAYKLSDNDLVLGKYILVQFGKKKNFIITVK
jgi:tyrosyl-tRNA synthetase